MTDKEKIKEYLLTSSYFKNNNETDIADDMKLLDFGVITSVDMINLIGFLEKTFSIQIMMEDIKPENFQRIDDIVKFVNSKKNA